MSGAAKCPVCFTELSMSSNNNKVQQCPKCRREYHLMKSESFKSNSNYDLEAIGEAGEGGSSPVLLTLDQSIDDLNKTGIQREKEKDYLKRYFPNADIDTIEYQPTE